MKSGSKKKIPVRYSECMPLIRQGSSVRGQDQLYFVQEQSATKTVSILTTKNLHSGLPVGFLTMGVEDYTIPLKKTLFQYPGGTGIPDALGKLTPGTILG